MIILTHPANRDFIESIHQKSLDSLSKFGIIPSRLSGIPIVFRDTIPQYVDSKTKYVSAYDKFIEHEPSDWEIYFGFMVPEKEVNFILFDDRKYSVYNS